MISPGDQIIKATLDRDVAILETRHGNTWAVWLDQDGLPTIEIGTWGEQKEEKTPPKQPVSD